MTALEQIAAESTEINPYKSNSFPVLGMLGGIFRFCSKLYRKLTGENKSNQINLLWCH